MRDTRVVYIPWNVVRVLRKALIEVGYPYVAHRIKHRHVLQERMELNLEEVRAILQALRLTFEADKWEIRALGALKKRCEVVKKQLAKLSIA